MGFGLGAVVFNQILAFLINPKNLPSTNHRFDK